MIGAEKKYEKVEKFEFLSIEFKDRLFSILCFVIPQLMQKELHSQMSYTMF